MIVTGAFTLPRMASREPSVIKLATFAVGAWGAAAPAFAPAFPLPAERSCTIENRENDRAADQYGGGDNANRQKLVTAAARHAFLRIDLMPSFYLFYFPLK